MRRNAAKTYKHLAAIHLVVCLQIYIREVTVSAVSKGFYVSSVRVAQ